MNKLLLLLFSIMISLSSHTAEANSETLIAYGYVSNLPECEGEQDNYRTNCVGTYKWDDGWKYFGEYQNDKRHGVGIFNFKDPDDEYFGEMINDAFSGSGIMTYPDGAVWAGDWKNDQVNGLGVFVEDGFIEQGIYSDGYFQSDKKYLPKNASKKDTYSGSFLTNGWTCNPGYQKFKNYICLKSNSTTSVSIPKNAKASGSSWTCNPGFTKTGKTCINNAELEKKKLDEQERLEEQTRVEEAQAEAEKKELSSLSTQGSCPGGGEPTKTVSADGSYFEYKCDSKSDKKSTDSNRVNLKVLNLLDVDDQYLIDLLEYSESKIKNIPANKKTFALFLPVGGWAEKQDINVYGDQQDVFKVILNKTQMENIFNELDEFVIQAQCFDNNSTRAIKEIKNNLKKGFLLYYYFPLCNNSSIIAYYIEKDWYPRITSDESSFNINHTFRKKILSISLLHEAYHSFQKIYFLPNECSAWNTPNYRFLLEGGADYFASYYQLSRLNKLHLFDEYILRQVTTRDSTDSSTVLGGGDNYHLQHLPGLAAINLMINKGWVDQKSILDGSFFDDCKGLQQFLLGGTKLKYLNDNWWKIEVHNGDYRFNPSLSIKDEAKTLYSPNL